MKNSLHFLSKNIKSRYFKIKVLINAGFTEKNSYKKIFLKLFSIKLCLLSMVSYFL